MDYIELFAGGGGGIQAHTILNGHTVALAAEINPFAIDVLQRRVGCPIVDDVRKVRGQAYDGIGMVCGGFPCQDISAAGNKIGLDGAKSSLFYDMMQIVSDAQPQYVFAENSPRLRTAGLHSVLLAMRKIGYHRIAWGTISGADVGAFHLRKRMWVMAKRGGSPGSIDLPAALPTDGVLVGGRVMSVKPWIPRVNQGDLPTITVADGRKSGNRPDKSLWSLSDALGVTAKADRHGSGRRGQGRSTRMILPTIAATDWKSPYSAAGLEKQLAKRSKPLRDILPYLEGGVCINPDWAEWYMGWVPGWTSHDTIYPAAWARVMASRSPFQGEDRFLPRTLMVRPPGFVGRITCLGNGQIPLCAAVSERLLKAAVDDMI